MPLTTDQIRNLHKLDTDTQIEIMHECAENLGVVSVEEYCLVMCKKKRAIYYAIGKGKIKHVIIGGCKFLCIND